MPDVVAAHYARRQQLARRTSERARRIWREIDPLSLTGSWALLVEQVAAVAIEAQLRSAGMAEEYLDLIVGSEEAAGRVNPPAFAGTASDGRPLISLLELPVVKSKVALLNGYTLDQALQVGANNLGMIVGTQVQDAGRVADGVGVTARPGVGWIRELRTPSCPRCIILAGRWYRWSDGFDRHPRCDCTHRPARSRDDVSTFDAKAYFDSLSAAEQDRVFTKAGAQAIRDGADIGQVVNARRGMTPAGTTLEGTTKRGLAGRRAWAQGDEFTKANAISRYTRTGRRLMPEQIYAMSETREAAVELLRRFAFIV